MKYKRAKPRKARAQMLASKFVHRLYFEKADCEKYGDRANEPIIEWCRETYGTAFVEWAWSIRHFKHKPVEIVYYFRTKEDAMLFILMWG